MGNWRTAGSPARRIKEILDKHGLRGNIVIQLTDDELDGSYRVKIDGLKRTPQYQGDRKDDQQLLIDASNAATEIDESVLMGSASVSSAYDQGYREGYENGQEEGFEQGREFKAEDTNQD